MTLERRLPQDVRVLLLENIHPDATALLSKAGYQVETSDRALARPNWWNGWPAWMSSASAATPR